MPIGDVEAALYKKPAAVFLAKTFGAKGLHDHLRIAPLVKYASKHYRGRNLRVLEIGCGEGWCLFELAKILGSRMRGEGYDFDSGDIAIARRIAAARFPQITFHCEDATKLADMGEVFDVVLFMDFLEHVENPASIIRNVSPCLRKGGEIVVSVPTPRYPAVFTREMHERIGHVLDGYTEETLRALFPAEFELALLSRNTGVPAQYGCWIQARLPRLPKMMAWAGSILLTSVFRRLDWFNGSSSASLFAVFKKS
ncbi:MAG: hypothetical protein JWO80_475 [Bryobacterales bacterium]|nr:hypothetical protein [Bryobacterales bacterium]